MAVPVCEKLKAWPALAIIRQLDNVKVQNSIQDELIMWGINAAGDNIWRARK
jgi:hypothetical protein